jgi:hypothetical protein
VPVEDEQHRGERQITTNIGSILRRITRAWMALEPERRLAAIAALALFVTMFFPWYQQNAVVSTAKSEPLVSRNLSAFAVFSFVEAAVLLVAVAVLCLLFARAERRSFHLPGGDGTVVFAAGLWSALLLILRLFDKPGITHNGVAANVGIQWGIFFALAAAGLLAYSGSLMRSARRGEPPLMRQSASQRRARTRTPTEQPAEDPTIMIPRDQPTKEDPPAKASQRERYPPPPTASGRARNQPSEPQTRQLSLEDEPAPRSTTEEPKRD